MLLSAREETKLSNLLLDLIDIADSFDQLTKLAAIADLLYSPETGIHNEFYKSVEKTARHLRRLSGPPIPHLRGNCTHGPCEGACDFSCKGPAGEPGPVGGD